MLVEEYGQYHGNGNEKTDIVVVSRSGSEEPDHESEHDQAPEPLANDCMDFIPLFTPIFEHVASID